MGLNFNRPVEVVQENESVVVPAAEKQELMEVKEYNVEEDRSRLRQELVNSREVDNPFSR